MSTMVITTTARTLLPLCLIHLDCYRELDVVATVNNLARSCPMFWTSDELKRSCQAGDWLALDRDTVAKVTWGHSACCHT
jgi:hypothetical protein